jgi:hypothetical protein
MRKQLRPVRVVLAAGSCRGKDSYDRSRRISVQTAFSVTNTVAVIQIASRVEELAGQEGLSGLKIRTETDGTTTFAHEAISVHLFEADRELHIRGPGSAAAVQIDAAADATGQLSQTFVGAGASTIVALLRNELPAS